jgi:hypothetical protein
MLACAGVRLHVDVVGAEQFTCAGDGERFGHVHELAAAVVAPAGVALGVLVRQDAAGRFEHGQADEVLGGDQLEALVLPPPLVRDGARDLRVDLLQVRQRERLGRLGSGGHRSILA